MLPALFTEENLGIMLVMLICITCVAPRRCRIWCYIALARFYGLVALLARTRVFIFLIFFYLVAGDVCHAIIRAVKPWVIAKFGAPGRIVMPDEYDQALSAAFKHPAPPNAQLLAWIQEDAEQARKAKADTRKKEMQKAQELRDNYRALAVQDPDCQAPDWSLIEMDSRGRIGL